MAIPVYQPYIKVDKFTTKVQEQFLNVQKWMRSQAEEGYLMIETQDLLTFLEGNAQFITKLEQNGIIHTTMRQFGSKKQVFHSLNLDLISHECLLWCCRSLKNDEMTPNEKAVQSRIKEVFCYKVTTWLWDHIIDSIKKSSSSFTKTHSYTISNPQSSSHYIKGPTVKPNQHFDLGKLKNKHIPRNQLHSKEDYDITELMISDAPEENKASRNKPSIANCNTERWSHSNKRYISTRNGKKLYYLFDNINKEPMKFELEEDFCTTESNVSGTNSTQYIIYPMGESWIGIDQSTGEVDADLYEKFLTFLKEYFTGDLKNFWNKYEAPQNTDLTDSDEKKLGKHRNSTEVGDKKSLGLMNYTPEEGPRAIPGGRYGCAQFIKTCGPAELSN